MATKQAKKQNTKATATATKAQGSISLSKAPVKPTTAPTTAPVKHVVTTPLTVNQPAPVNVAKGSAPKQPAQQANQLTPMQQLHKSKGAPCSTVNAFFNGLIGSRSGLTNKVTIASMYHAFCSYAAISQAVAKTKQHTCCPTLFYTNGGGIGGTLVAMALNPAHYACNAFNGIYQGKLTVHSTKGLSSAVLNQQAALPLIQQWATIHSIKNFNVAGYWQHVSKLLA